MLIRIGRIILALAIILENYGGYSDRIQTPFDNDLRITYGKCKTPGQNSCAGIDTRGRSNSRLFRKVGRTISELKAQNWRNWGWSRSCQNDGLYNGFQWFDPTEPLSVVFLLDIQGTIAGVQFWFPYAEASMDYAYSRQTIMRNATLSGVDYYYATYYFINPELICTRGRSVNDLRRDGTVADLYIQTGASPKYSERVAMTRESSLQAGWGENMCVPAMGWHGYYDPPNWDLDWCTSFRPTFLLFDHSGELSGVGFTVPGEGSAPSFERPPNESMKMTTANVDLRIPAPQCTAGANGRTSIHIYFTENPYDFKCPNWPMPPNPDGNENLSVVKSDVHFIDYLDSLPVSTSFKEIKRKLPVCVIGAGMSGFGVAAELDRKGYLVEIFEKTSRLGGKAFTFRKGNELQLEMGPLFISPKSEKLVGYIDDFNLTRIPFNEKDRKGYSIESMKLLDIPSPSDSSEVVRDVKKYIELLRKYEPELQYGYLDTSEELFVSIYDWLKTNKLGSEIAQVIVLLMTAGGYGALEDIPAIYVLQLVDEYKIKNLIKPNVEPFFTVGEGLDYLLDKIASTLKAEIHLNHEVKFISRERYHQIIKFHGGLPDKKCSKVILAFPPLLSNLRKIMTLADLETEVLGQVRINRYTSAAHRIPAWDTTFVVEAFNNEGPNGSVQLASPYGIGEPVTFVRLDHGTMKNAYISYSWIRGSYDSIASGKDLELINTKLNTALMKVGRDSQTFFQFNPEYFPHASPLALKNGFYRKFDKLQGAKGVYYATTLLNFEIMEKALDMGATLVNKYF